MCLRGTVREVPSGPVLGVSEVPSSPVLGVTPGSCLGEGCPLVLSGGTLWSSYLGGYPLVLSGERSTPSHMAMVSTPLLTDRHL